MHMQVEPELDTEDVNTLQESNSLSLAIQWKNVGQLASNFDKNLLSFAALQLFVDFLYECFHFYYTIDSVEKTLIMGQHGASVLKILLANVSCEIHSMCLRGKRKMMLVVSMSSYGKHSSLSISKMQQNVINCFHRCGTLQNNSFVLVTSEKFFFFDVQFHCQVFAEVWLQNNTSPKGLNLARNAEKYVTANMSGINAAQTFGDF